MSLLGLTGLINFLASLFLAILVLLKNPKEIKNKTYFWLNISVALFSLGYFLWQLSNKQAPALFWFRVLFVGVVLINPTYLHFSFSVLDKNKSAKKTLFLIYFVNIIFIILNFMGKLYPSVEPRFNLGYWPNPTNYFHAYLFFWFGQCFYGFYHLINGYFHSTGQKKQQLKYFILAAAIGFFGGASNWLVWYKIPLPPYLNILVTVYVSITAYAIAVHHLIDFDLLTHYSFMAGVGSLIGFGVTSGLLLLLKYLFPNVFVLNTWIILTASTIAAFFIFSSRYILDFLYTVSNEIILQHKYDFIKQMPDKSRDWTKYLKIGDLLKTVKKDFTETMRLGVVRILLSGDWVYGSHDAAKSFYEVNPDNLNDEAGFCIAKENHLLKYAGSQEQVIFASSLRQDCQNPNLPQGSKEKISCALKETENLAAEIFIPLLYQDRYLSYLIGLVSLGGLDEKVNDFLKEKSAPDFFADLAKDLNSAFQHALENRRQELVGEKKGNLLDQMIQEARRLEEDKEKIAKDLVKAKTRSSRMGDLASKFAAKIQLLNESQEDFDVMLRYVPSGVIIIRDGLIRSANKQARRFLVEFGEKILNEPFEKILTTQFKNTGLIVEDIRRVLATGLASRTFETEWIKENQPMPVEIKIIPLKDRTEIGQVRGALVEIVDISEVKDRQRLWHMKDKFETFKEVVRGFDHEIRNPINILNSMAWAVKHMKEKVLNEKDFVENFCDAVPKAVQFIQDLLINLTETQVPDRLEGTSATDIHQALEEALKLLGAKIEEASVKVEKNLGSLPKIVANLEHLKNAFYEVLKNSVEAIVEFDRQRVAGQTPKIGGVVAISTRINELGEIEIKIADNGIGIDESRVDKVLNPFHTTKIHSVQNPESGAGLGLSKVYNIAQKYGGLLKIESKLAVGTTVTLIFKKEIITVPSSNEILWKT